MIYANRDIIAITDGNALLADVYNADTEGINLTSAILDLDAGTLLLVFNDILNASTLNVNQISIQNYSVFPLLTQQLTGGAVERSLDALAVTIQLDISDLNLLKSNLALATTRNNSFISIVQDAIVDLADNGLEATVSQVDNFIPDESEPTLIDFSFDLNVGLLNLTFSETVNFSTFDPTSLGATEWPSCRLCSINWKESLLLSLSLKHHC